MKRIEEIFSLITKTEVFADIGCDHGYISEKVVKNNIADIVIIADISEPSLEKARILLSDYIDSGKVKAYVSDGFKNITESVTEALISGMGGEEIISILSACKNLPEKIILQPMKNSDCVRRYINSVNYKIIKDYTFFDLKYYDIIVAEKGSETLTLDEIQFGKTNLEKRPEAFLNKLVLESQKIEKYLANNNLSENSKQTLKNKKERISKILCLK